MEISIEELRKKFEELPEDLRWAIMGVQVDEKIMEIGKSQNLNIEQMGQLALETNLVMFGLLHPDKFKESIQQSLSLPEFKTRNIIEEINEKILKEVKEKYMSLYRKEEEKEEGEILNSTGINILENKEEIEENISELNKEDMLKKIENVDIINAEMANKQKIKSLLNQKLTNAFQIPNAQNQYNQKDLNINNNKNLNLNKTENKTSPSVNLNTSANNNIQPNNSTIMGNIKPSSSSDVKLSPSFSPNRTDPYREKLN